MTTPLVSVVVPCRNEVRFIESCISSITATDYPHDCWEVIVVDGLSDDGTRKILMQAASDDARISLLDNPARITPTAMNLGIRRARGEVILRMDAHCEYPPSYIPTLVRALAESGAVNVGGITHVLPAKEGPIAASIALALAHPVGVGDSYFRIGTSAPRWVDTVPFGCWRRETFEANGLFDESLPRNQDDEFNMRLRRNGGHILLLPNVATRYYARSSLDQLWRMFAQYGYYKPLAALRAATPLRPRQFAPAALVLLLAMSAILGSVSLSARWIFAVSLGAYASIILAAGLPIALRHGLRVSLAFAAALPTMHFAYGLGFLRGVLHFAILKRAPDAVIPELSR